MVKLGAEGALWTDGSDEERVAGRAPPARSLDTTGAGDAFAAGLLAARLSGAAGGGARRGLRAGGPGGRHARRPAAAPFLQARAHMTRGKVRSYRAANVSVSVATTGIRSTSTSFTPLLRQRGFTARVCITVGNGSLRSRGRSRETDNILDGS